MYTINATFFLFDEIPLSSMIGATGVYVIWDGQARARPTYIGEGTVLKRLADHAAHGTRRFCLPWNGYVAFIAGSTRGVHKCESQAVERLLLDVANDTDRNPMVNAHPGSASIVEYFCKGEMLRVAVRGYDPLIAPKEARPLTRVKEIKAWQDGANYGLDHDWRFRRLRKV